MVNSQTFHDHVKELRRRTLWVVVAIGISAGISYALRVRIISVLQRPLGAPLFYTSPAGSFNFVIKLSMIIGMFITLPIIIYQLLRFIEPALPKRINKSFMMKVIGASFLLALAGIAFGYFYMIPLSLKFFAGYSTKVIKPLISANEYLSYVSNNLIIFALVFQIPLIILFINWIKPIKPSQLLKYQRHVVVGAFGLAIVLPFTYDPLSQFIVAIPIVVLYYISVVLLLVANRGHKKFAETLMPEPLAPAQLVFAAKPLVSMAVPQPTPLRPRLSSIDGFIRPTSSPVMKPVTPVVVSEAKVIPTIKRRQLNVDGIIRPLPYSPA